MSLRQYLSRFVARCVREQLKPVVRTGRKTFDLLRERVRDRVSDRDGDDRRFNDASSAERTGGVAVPEQHRLHTCHVDG